MLETAAVIKMHGIGHSAQSSIYVWIDCPLCEKSAIRLRLPSVSLHTGIHLSCNAGYVAVSCTLYVVAILYIIQYLCT